MNTYVFENILEETMRHFAPQSIIHTFVYNMQNSEPKHPQQPVMACFDRRLDTVLDLPSESFNFNIIEPL